ncbi:DUF3558 family protein [Saccharomonospora sp. CUA-673]|uniref:DUF3558 family protein n=1 Tax=Saccharomonospora sp. CUA-673 TaxID=1904969 RepID=UPI0009FB1D89|nr:DUF3558 family protein [Saccharomonospora sp. CUA-673]
MVAATVVGMFAFLGAGCSPDEEGSARPEGTASPAPSAPSSPQGGDAGEALAGLEPCQLIGADQLAEFGDMAPGQPENVGTARDCRFDLANRESTERTLLISVGIRDQQGISDAQDRGNGIDHGEVDGRQFARIPSTGSCTVAIGVTESSRVDVYAGTTDGTEEACRIADEVAAMVEPELPQG